jgi:amino acid transporter
MRPMQVWTATRRLLLGNPLSNAAASQERLTRSRALGAFGLDALSSVAYGPDEILYVLLLAGAAGLALDVPVALAIALLLIIVATSYRQTIFAYPRGGGSYTVARQNLGTYAGLIAAAALIVDYLTTVAVSVTAGVQSITAFAPILFPYRVAMAVGCIVLLVVINLRGVREAGAAFVLPTYIFIGSLGLLLLWGALRFTVLSTPPHAAPAPPAVEGLSIFLVLRAFSGGCTAMTGIEAMANGVPAFKRPESRNAAATLFWLATTLATLFLGVVVLGRAIGAVPSDRASVVAQIGLSVVGTSPLFYLVQLSAAVILLLAANTSFNGFPRLAAIMAEDHYLPHQFRQLGIRLAYSTGIVVLSVLAIGLIVLFNGSTHALIPLFAIGVFLCFTLSQAGMVQHWLRTRSRGWRPKLFINGLGAVTTAVVTVIVVVSKFTEGAWLVVLIVPLLVLMFLSIHRTYVEEIRELAAFDAPRPEPFSHELLVLVGRLDRSVANAVAYALSVSSDVTAVHVSVDPEATEQLVKEWKGWGPGLPLEVIESPYRDLIGPLRDFVEARVTGRPQHQVTVVLPEVVPRRTWQEALHNQANWRLMLALRGTPGVALTMVPVRL